MARKFIALLLLVVLVVSCTITGAEKSMKELDREFDQLLEDFKNNQKIIDTMEEIKKVLNNGYPTFPNTSPGDLRLEEVQIGLPEGFDHDFIMMSEQRGTPYLVTGTVTSVDGLIWEIDTTDSNHIRVMAKCYLDSETQAVKAGSSIPAVGDIGNFLVTFFTWDFNNRVSTFLLNISDEEYHIAVD